MRWPRFQTGVLLVCVLLALTGVSLQVQGTEAEESYYYVDISTSPAHGFLQASNLAPGDTVRSVLTVANNGNLDFNTSVSARQETGNTAFYNILHVTVADSNGLLYEGSFAGLQDFPLGTIPIGQQRYLTFTATLPLATGNEMQGQATSVAFDLTAIGHEEQIPLGDECFEPPFSNRNFTLHQNSTVPIKFHLHDAYGLIDDSLHADVRLEVTGPGVNGGDVKYVFAIADGTLKFGESRKDPHYLARFSTWDDPVVTDGWYTATVFVGSQPVCQKTFQVLAKGNRSNAP
ncbi:MAG TPA: hypothetical protein VFV52_01495 [Bacilli bacterium]|nr:hypothetical protein [Bacilli bacterium]